jgi:hypothetical protein
VESVQFHHGTNIYSFISAACRTSIDSLRLFRSHLCPLSLFHHSLRLFFQLSTSRFVWRISCCSERRIFGEAHIDGRSQIPQQISFLKKNPNRFAMHLYIITAFIYSDDDFLSTIEKQSFHREKKVVFNAHFVDPPIRSVAGVNNLPVLFDLLVSYFAFRGSCNPISLTLSWKV